jgi:hypothetical protein
MDNALSFLDRNIKNSILFSPFTPSRQHVLEYMFFTNGNHFVWAKDNETGLYVLTDASCLHADGSFNRDAMPQHHNESKLQANIKTLDDKRSGGIELANLVHQWIYDNIDDYCQSTFSYDTIDLRPQEAPLHISYSSNCLYDMPDADSVHPDYLNAIKECCEYTARQIPIDVEGVKIDARNLSLVRTTCPQFAHLFLLIINTMEKIEKSAFGQQQKQRASALLARIWGQDRIQKRYMASVHSNDISFEEYLSYKARASDYLVHYTVDEFITYDLKDQNRFFHDGKPNAAFYAQAQDVLQHLSPRYFSVEYIAGSIIEKLEISDWNNHHALDFARDTIQLGVCAS